jgi:hypothetical protein
MLLNVLWTGFDYLIKMDYGLGNMTWDVPPGSGSRGQKGTGSGSATLV